MHVDFSQYLEAIQSRTNRFLNQLLPIPEEHSADQLVAAMRYSSTLGGKRIRPLLVYASNQAITDSSTLQNNALSAIDICACAVECIHAYSLIHDDLPAMDNDNLRRGHPTCHIAFNEATAILAGDALQCQAFELLASIDTLPPARVLTLIQILAAASGAKGMVAGQAIDLAAVNLQPDLDYLEQMHNRKTGALIKASVLLGARASDKVTDEQIAALSLYADSIGLAFQVQDDILDITASTQELGKQQGADLALNKPTYVSLLGVEQAQNTAQNLLQQALDSLSNFGSSADPLRQLATYIVARRN